MPKEQEQFQDAVKRILEAVMFENWLRFHFINDTGDEENPELAVPEKAMEKIRALHPELLPLAESLNGRTVSFQASQSAVCTYVLRELDGKALQKNMAPAILQSVAFQTHLQLFNTWVQLHEDQLDQRFLEFNAWKDLFSRWLATPGAKELAQKLSTSLQAPQK